MRSALNSALAPPFIAPVHEAPKPRVPMFQFRVHCPAGLRFDVQAATEADARAHVKKRHSAKISKVELIGEVKPNVRLL